jgi:hypothetical protein
MSMLFPVALALLGYLGGTLPHLGRPDQQIEILPVGTLLKSGDQIEQGVPDLAVLVTKYLGELAG